MDQLLYNAIISRYCKKEYFHDVVYFQGKNHITHSETVSKILEGPRRKYTIFPPFSTIDSFHIVSAHAPNSLVPRYLREITREGVTFILLPYITQWNMENN